MHLVQLLLPVYDNAGRALARDLFDTVRQELVDRFGGLTAYTRAPATGLWADGTEVDKDEIVVYEVMVDELEQRFAQDELMIRALETERL